MYTISKDIEFDAAHRLLDYVGPCAVLHGHRYLVSMVFTSATLNESGFVIDFSDVKREVKAWVDLHWDHGTLLNVRDPLAPILKEMNQKLYLMEFNPTAENIAFELYDVFIKVYSNLSSVIVWETPTSQAVYTPKAQAHSGGYTM